MESKNDKKTSTDKPYLEYLFNNSFYKDVILDLLNSAKKTYRYSLVMSLILYGIGLIFLGIAIYNAICGDTNDLVIILGALGTANILILMIFKPIENIQRGVKDLSGTIFVVLSFLAQYDYLAQYLVTMSELPILDDSRNLDLESDRVRQLTHMMKEYLALLK